MKDYYKILGVKPAAALPEIKKAYRALAFKYHPDKNPESSLSEAAFKELQEAYATLSNTEKRAGYDDARWLSGMGSKTQYKEAVTPGWLVKISKELNTSLSTMDTHRMSQKALQAYIMLLLSDAHLGVLEHANDVASNDTIITEILKATKKLEIKYLGEIEQRLKILANGNNLMLQAIDEYIVERIEQARNEKRLPYLILLITLALCVFMYLYSK